MANSVYTTEQTLIHLSRNLYLKCLSKQLETPKYKLFNISSFIESSHVMNGYSNSLSNSHKFYLYA